MENNIILPVAAAAALFFATRKKESGTYTPPTNYNTAIAPPTAPMIPTTAGDDNGGLTIANVEPPENERINYRENWLNLLQTLLNQGDDLPTAISTVWDLFNNPENPFLALFPNKEALFMNLATYLPFRGKDKDNAASVTNTASITWDSTPIYDNLNCVWNCANDFWTCADWQFWHIKLEEHFGDTYQANAVWNAAWNSPDNQCYLSIGFGCPETSYCRYDCNFVEYMYSKGITIGNLASNAYCDLTGVTLNILQSTANVTQSIEDLTDGVRDTTTTFKFLFPTLAAVGFAVWVYNSTK